MANEHQINRLDDAIESLLAGRHEGLAFAEPELATLLVVAADLRELPDPAFKARLGRELVPAREEKTMNATIGSTHEGETDELRRRLGQPTQPAVPVQEIRKGAHTVVPYLVVDGGDDMLAFLHQAFDAEERGVFRRPDGSIMHAQLRIGNSLVELGETPDRERHSVVPLHLYVEDADRVYARALAAGGTSLYEMTDMPYGDREGGVRDRWGNHWYIATRQENVSEAEVTRRFGGGAWTPNRDARVEPVPPGLRTVTVGLRSTGTEQLIGFIERVLGARESEQRTLLPDGSIMHTKMQVGDTVLELGEAHAPWGPMKVHLHVFVDDVDEAYERALAAGGTTLYPLADMPYGERGGGVLDPFGNSWYFARVL